MVWSRVGGLLSLYILTTSHYSHFHTLSSFSLYKNSAVGGGRPPSLAELGCRFSGGGGWLFRKRKKKIEIKGCVVMGFWRQIIFPVRRVWLAVYGRLKARKNGQFFCSLFALLFVRTLFFLLSHNF